MAKQKKQAVGFDFSAAGGGEKKPDLLIRNISGQIVAIPGIPAAMTDPFLMPWQEIVVDGPAWRENPNLRAHYLKGTIALEWVERGHVARALPRVENAPADVLPESQFDRTHALEIAMQLDVNRSLELINQDVDSRDTNETDVAFMKQRMHKILRLAQWLEEGMQNRKQVLAAIRDRLAWIRSL